MRLPSLAKHLCYSFFVLGALHVALGACTVVAKETTCDPRDLGACESGHVCDAATKTCIKEQKCVVDADCPDHFGCGLNRCRRDCYNFIAQGPLDAACQHGFVCTAAYACVSATSCDPSGSAPDLACNHFVCDGSTKSCVAPTACTSDAACGKYRCNSVAKTCLQTCADDADCRGAKCKDNQCQ